MDSGNHSNVCNHSENQTIKDVSVDKESALSKNCLRKLRHHEQVLQSKRNKRKEKKVLRKQRTLYEKQKSAEELDTFHISKKEEKQMMQHRLMSARGTAQRICVDLGFSCSMSEKELHKLSSQLRRLYGSNRHSQHPLHVFFANFSQESSLYRICREKNQGFEKYVVDMNDKSPQQLFRREELIYLSPDSPHVLTDLNPEVVYVIGGLVDETVKRKLSLQAAEQSGLLTARLPIIEWLERGSKGTFSTVLSVNQVFDILLKYHETNDWTHALLTGIPPRKGFIPKSNVKSSSPQGKSLLDVEPTNNSYPTGLQIILK
ncbi:tRNA methyltransferase 10 homolog B-like isoform X3 [Tachypleus tridentatus]|uniref:tRNA methyltransferase 10 homolog B-like isoform X3 n=1 Tax=Tachypleus tridentatus TaxID=6853 RepID=UPI003FD33A80